MQYNIFHKNSSPFFFFFNPFSSSFCLNILASRLSFCSLGCAAAASSSSSSSSLSCSSLFCVSSMSFRGLGRPSASSGMGVATHSKDTFMELKRKKMHRYVIFKIDEKKKEVVVEKTGGPAESYDDFAAALPENDCRYAVYDFDFVTSDNCQKSKIFFIAWSPASSRIRAKMLYATSKDRFKHDLDGLHYDIQATDPTEMDLDVLRDRAN